MALRVPTKGLPLPEQRMDPRYLTCQRVPQSHLPVAATQPRTSPRIQRRRSTFERRSTNSPNSASAIQSRNGASTRSTSWPRLMSATGNSMFSAVIKPTHVNPASGNSPNSEVPSNAVADFAPAASSSTKETSRALAARGFGGNSRRHIQRILASQTPSCFERVRRGGQRISATQNHVRTPVTPKIPRITASASVRATHPTGFGVTTFGPKLARNKRKRRPQTTNTPHRSGLFHFQTKIALPCEAHSNSAKPRPKDMRSSGSSASKRAVAFPLTTESGSTSCSTPFTRTSNLNTVAPPMRRVAIH